MSGIFGNYRSAHHPDEDIRLPLAMAYLQGKVDNADAQRILERRDRRCRLEMESSALSGILIEPLARACPTKRFILTIRDVYSWCDSWIDHNINSPADAGSPWTALDEIRLRAKEIEPTRLDAPLVARGFPSLSCFFRLWAEHNTRVLDAVETNRLLVVRTHEITEQIPEIAAWAGVRAETLRVDQSWLFAAPQKHDVLSMLDERYVRETADRFCSALMAVYFPDVSWGGR
jgi:hypothetical protein